jgi:hypothetical protein
MLDARLAGHNIHIYKVILLGSPYLLDLAEVSGAESRVYMAQKYKMLPFRWRVKNLFGKRAGDSRCGNSGFLSIRRRP